MKLESRNSKLETRSLKLETSFRVKSMLMSFVVITTSYPQTQLMAMSLSSQIMAKGKSLRILLCGHGGDLALKDGKEVILKPINKSPQMLLKNLIGNNVKVEICPFYLANRGRPYRWNCACRSQSCRGRAY